MSPNFITSVIDEDLKAGRYQTIVTRFPPEPNGYLHIGHAKSICLNFGLALDYGGACNLRFDDTNPETEDPEYVLSIKKDVEWLGFKWDRELYASDYFDQLYEFALQLIKDGKAYVDSLSDEEIGAYRGTITEPGRPSPYRGRTVEENLDLFERMRKGEFPNGAHVLRAKIDLASPNMKLRDPVLYRIVHASHYRAGNKWCIYPLYDFAHPLSDAIEGVSHSLCTLEFENNRAIYDWLLENLRGKCGLPESPRPYQYEFARLNLDYTLMSKRKLLQLVQGGQVNNWDDPRMPTLSGLRRRGVTPAAIREFIKRIGVAKANSWVDAGVLEAAIRDDLNFTAPRVLAVLRPLKVVITNFPQGRDEDLEAPYWPHDVPREGSRRLPFSREIFIEQDDFAENPPKGFHRLFPGGRVRLRHAYVIRCDEVLKDASGAVTELRCSYDPDTLGKNPSDGAVKGTVHWVSAPHAVKAEFRLYDRLFTVPNPEEGESSFIEHLNPESLVCVQGLVEPSVLADAPDTRYQFERLGYFWRDPVDCGKEGLVFNRIVTLKDSWAKTEAESQQRKAESSKPALPATGHKPQTEPVLSAEQLARFNRFKSQGIGEAEARVLAREPKLEAYLLEAAKNDDIRGLASWVVNELGSAIRAGEKAVSPSQLAQLVALVKEGIITNRIAKGVLEEAIQRGADPAELVKQKGLRQLSDAADLEPIVERLIRQNPDKANALRGGRTGLMGFFVGQAMRETGGRANAEVVQRLVNQKLNDIESC
ncbi:MAG: glutamine--tRNA ligase/YqeY domain fusion protein [Deinococcus sp.]|nr:glutamine--tRNA ligase/YqeY domain fusion protein [Deinococcus sp.]MCL5964403.1 glutamine--tRNA ligase/YqeY domain fusion protein [Deinococcus sp.]